MTEIERLARVIRIIDLQNSHPINAPPFMLSTAAIEARVQANAEALVRAILEAMREPSEGMKGAGCYTFPRHEYPNEMDRDDARDCWQATIDHVLSEEAPETTWSENG